MLRYALYVAFFPQLEAGPIERASRLVPQVQKDKFANPQRFRDGLWLIGYGLNPPACGAFSDAVCCFARLDILARLRAIRFIAIGAAVVLVYDIMLFGVFEKVDFIYFKF